MPTSRADGAIQRIRRAGEISLRCIHRVAIRLDPSRNARAARVNFPCVCCVFAIPQPGGSFTTGPVEASEGQHRLGGSARRELEHLVFAVISDVHVAGPIDRHTIGRATRREMSSCSFTAI